MHTTSATLIERLRSGDHPHAWPTFVSLYTPLLIHWARRRLGVPAEETADFVQDVFLLLVGKLPEFSYDPARRFRAWLWTVVRNRWRERQRRVVPALHVGGAALESVSVPDPAEEADAVEYRRFLTARAFELMRAELHSVTWRACWELVVESRPAAEVAAELGMSLNAVYIARSRALRKLRQRLAGLLD